MNRFPNSILELNQVAAMFFSEKFHSGIEPLFLVTFPHKTPLFHFLKSFWTHGYLYTPPAPVCWFSSFTLPCSFSRHLCCSTGLDLKTGVISSKQYDLRHLRSTPFLTPKPKVDFLTKTLTKLRLCNFAHKTAYFIRAFPHKKTLF